MSIAALPGREVLVLKGLQKLVEEGESPERVPNYKIHQGEEFYLWHAKLQQTLALRERMVKTSKDASECKSLIQLAKLRYIAVCASIFQLHPQFTLPPAVALEGQGTAKRRGREDC